MTYRLYQSFKTTRKLRIWLALGILLTGFSVANIGYVIAASDDSLITNQVYINEIKSGGTNTAPAQYVTLYNASDSSVSLKDWRIEYAKQTFPTDYCALADWDKSASSLVNVASSQITISPHSISPAIELSINDNDSGSVHIVDSQQTIHDTVGWGTDTSPAPCFETTQTPKLTASKSLQRYLGCVSNLPIDTDDNAGDFALSDTPAPGQPGTTAAPQCTPPEPEIVPLPEPETVPETEQPSTPIPTPPIETPILADCTGIVISELLSNPAGSDTGHEFIELHNPTNEVINLQDCKLQTSGNSSTYTFETVSVQPGEYLALYDGTTGLNLPNASGGTVWLLDSTDELQAVTYPADPEDDVVWASFEDGSWSLSYTATPNGANTITPLKPCDDGLVRNPDTNRCVSPEPATATGSTSTVATATTSSNLAACKAGQERNPETNRCRNIATSASASTQTPCKEGQERNPDTNRCRNIVTATAAKACPEGQERNADTNRCRKITAAGAANGSGPSGIQDITTESAAANKPYALIAIIAVGAAIAYGIYEWRQEVIGFFRRRLGKTADGALLSA